MSCEMQSTTAAQYGPVEEAALEVGGRRDVHLRGLSCSGSLLKPTFQCQSPICVTEQVKCYCRKPVAAVVLAATAFTSISSVSC